MNKALQNKNYVPVHCFPQTSFGMSEIHSAAFNHPLDPTDVLDDDFVYPVGGTEVSYNRLRFVSTQKFWKMISVVSGRTFLEWK